MLRIGYSDVFPEELLQNFPADVELIRLPETLENDVELDVWIPDPYASKAQKLWPRLRGVRLVLCLMAGTEWIPPLVGPHVTVCNARGAHNVSTAEWTVAAILSMMKHFPFYADLQHEGAWRRRFEMPARYAALNADPRPIYPPVMLEELTGKTVLMIGHGAIGQEIERMLEPFRVRLLRVARTERAEPRVHAVRELHALLPQVDVVVLILPHTAESTKLIGAPELALLRAGALLVNAARGPVVDTDALVRELQSGRIRAALDVTDPEPLPQEHPLWKCPNLLLTPHVAGSTPQFAPRSFAVAAEELRRYLAGEPLANAVQLAV